MRWIGSKILTREESHSRGFSLEPSFRVFFLQDLYGEEVRKYHLDDLKTYCPRAAENPPNITSITRTAISLAGFPGQRAITLHSLFFDRAGNGRVETPDGRGFFALNFLILPEVRKKCRRAEAVVEGLWQVLESVIRRLSFS